MEVPRNNREWLDEFKQAIKAEDISELHGLTQVLCKSREDKDTTLRLDESVFRDFILTCCKNNRPKALGYLLDNFHTLLNCPGSDRTDKDVQDAFYFAMRSKNIHLLEMLYDHYSGDLHWSGHTAESLVENELARLGELLTAARDCYEKELKKEKLQPLQTLVDIHGVIQFNCFQVELYKELNALRTTSQTSVPGTDFRRLEEAKTLRKAMLSIICMYEKYSNHEEFRIRKYSSEEETKFQEKLKDESTVHWKSLLYCMYETYVNKLHCSVCLLILDNLYLLKQRLQLQVGSYETVESKVYHLITCIKNNWNIYLPKEDYEVSEKCITFDNDVKSVADFKYKWNRLHFSVAIYLEKRDFEKCLINFKSELSKACVTADALRKKGSTLPFEEVNSLTSIPYVRDSFSLTKMSYYIKALTTDFGEDDDRACLIVERILQVLGEFLKTTDESLHLQQTTVALTHAETSIETIAQLKWLRDLLSHVDKGQLPARIDFETNGHELFAEILRDLERLGEGIGRVVDIHKSRVQKSLIQNGMNLLRGRLNEVFEPLDDDFSVQMFMSQIRDTPCVGLNHPFHEGLCFHCIFKKKIAEKPGFSIKLVDEIASIQQNLQSLEYQKQSVTDTVHNFMRSKCLQYVKTIQEVLQRGDNVWGTSRTDLFLNVHLGPDPLKNFSNQSNATNAGRSMEDACDLSRNDSELLVGKLSSSEHFNSQWIFVKDLLAFIVNEAGVFDWHVFEIKHNSFTKELIHIKDLPSKEGVDSVNFLLRNLIDVDMISSSDVNEYVLQKNEFPAIKKLENLLARTNFLTNEEKIIVLSDVDDRLKKVGQAKKILLEFYKGGRLLNEDEYKELVNTLQLKKQEKDTLVTDYEDEENYANCISIVEGSRDSYGDLKTYIEQNIPLSGAEYKAIVASLSLGPVAKNVLLNLVLGKRRDPKALDCLSDRATRLRTLLSGTKRELDTTDHLVSRFIHDRKFRAALELLLVDVLNILAENAKKEARKKASRMLAGINIRNVLEHGNPLLEAMGDVLDPTDLPRELVCTALTFAGDVDSINALRRLVQELGEVDLIDIIENERTNTLNEQQRTLLTMFKQSERWSDYLPLTRKHDFEHKGQKSQPQTGVDARRKEKALNPVRSKQPNAESSVNLVQDLTHANSMEAIDFPLHTAAAKGKSDIIRAHLANGVDVNARGGKDENTPLHLAVKRGHENTVRVLLEGGADASVPDASGRGPLSYVIKCNPCISQLLIISLMRKVTRFIHAIKESHQNHPCN